MRDDLTDITLLLDRTGSMESIKTDVIGGYNEFLRQQREAPGEANFTLIQFDSENSHEIVHNALPIADVPSLNEKAYVPRAMTPLLDAMGHAIVSTGERLKAMAESERPSKVVFVVFTDGHENHSTEYTKERVREMVQTQERDFKWGFVFLGQGIDAFAEAGGMGINAATTTPVGMASVLESYAAAASNVASYRATGDTYSLNWTDAQRKRLAK